jgi:hypothetical protein
MASAPELRGRQNIDTVNAFVISNHLMTSAPTAYAVFGAQLGILCENDATDVKHKINATLRMTAKSFLIGGAPNSFLQPYAADRLHSPRCISSKTACWCRSILFFDQVGIARRMLKAAREKLQHSTLFDKTIQ